MTLTVTYSIAQILDLVLPALNQADNSDTIGYSNGYFATIAQDSGGGSSFTFYDPAGNVQRTGSTSLTDCKSALLYNADVIFAGDRSGGGIGVTVETNNGHAFIFNNEVISTDARDSNPDVAGLGFDAVVVYQRALSATNHDIIVSIALDDFYHTVTSFAVDNTTADDRNASVCSSPMAASLWCGSGSTQAVTAPHGARCTRPTGPSGRRRSRSTRRARSTIR